MAAGNTNDTRTHVMGDMLMVTGTFTDGGIDYYYGDQLSTVYAAGGHATSIYNTSIAINEADNIVVGETVITVDGVDVRLHFNVGETVYTSAGARVGTITAIASATEFTIGDGALTTMADDDTLYKAGPPSPAITLLNGTLDVAIDETNKYVVFGTGNMGNTSTAATLDGRWWILGKR